MYLALDSLVKNDPFTNPSSCFFIKGNWLMILMVEVKGWVAKPFIITPENSNKLNLTVYEPKNAKITGNTGDVKKI